eukprot:UN22649
MSNIEKSINLMLHRQDSKEGTPTPDSASHKSLEIRWMNHTAEEIKQHHLNLFDNVNHTRSPNSGTENTKTLNPDFSKSPPQTPTLAEPKSHLTRPKQIPALCNRMYDHSTLEMLQKK